MIGSNRLISPSLRAKRSNPPRRGTMDCFVATLLAKTSSWHLEPIMLRATTMGPFRSALLAALLLAPPASRAEPISIPVLVPLTGFLALEGQSQRNGALLAFAQAPGGLA